MDKARCLEKAEYWKAEAAKAEAEETALGRLYGFADPLCLAAGWRAHECEQQHMKWEWLASLDASARARLLEQLEAPVD